LPTGGFCPRGVFGGARFLAIPYQVAQLTSFTDMQGQSMANMQLKALYRLKFGLYYLVSIDIPTAKKVAKNVLYC